MVGSFELQLFQRLTQEPITVFTEDQQPLLCVVESILTENDRIFALLSPVDPEERSQGLLVLEYMHDQEGLVGIDDEALTARIFEAFREAYARANAVDDT